VPELAELDRRSIHNPSSSQRQVCGYPEPVIDYREARERVLGRFKALAELSKT
jgi:deoxyribodipyrimidine photo-lyase